ncbi:MAG: hypothetical protein L0216_19910 [Planctomycetales bacterium]|nr:hypothetical protein [Planctomycetales bacterium]
MRLRDTIPTVFTSVLVCGLSFVLSRSPAAAAQDDDRETTNDSPTFPSPARDSGAGEPAVPVPEAPASFRSLTTALPTGPAAGSPSAASCRTLSARTAPRPAARAVPILLADPQQPGTGAALR